MKSPLTKYEVLIGYNHSKHGNHTAKEVEAIDHQEAIEKVKQEMIEDLGAEKVKDYTFGFHAAAEGRINWIER